MYYRDGFRMRTAMDGPVVRRPYADSNALFSSMPGDESTGSQPQAGNEMTVTSSSNSSMMEGGTRIIAPPTTPSPHFGFRRHATTIATGGTTQPAMGATSNAQTAPWQPAPREEPAGRNATSNLSADVVNESNSSAGGRGNAYYGGNPFRRYGLYDPQVELKDAVNYDTHARSLSPSKEGTKDASHTRTTSDNALYTSDEVVVGVRTWHGTSNTHGHEKEHTASRHHTNNTSNTQYGASGLRNVYGIGPESSTNTTEGHSNTSGGNRGGGAVLALGDPRAALSLAQRERWQESLRHKSAVQRAAQQKMMEFMQYWLTLPTTRTRLEGLVRDTCSLVASTSAGSGGSAMRAGSRSPTAAEHVMPVVSPRVPGKVLQAWGATEKDDTALSTSATNGEAAGRDEKRSSDGGGSTGVTHDEEKGREAAVNVPAKSPTKTSNATPSRVVEQSIAAKKDVHRDEAATAATPSGAEIQDKVAPQISALSDLTATTVNTSHEGTVKEKASKAPVTPTRLPSPSGSSCSASEGVTLSGPQSATPPLQSEPVGLPNNNTSITNNNNTTIEASQSETGGGGLVPASVMVVEVVTNTAAEAATGLQTAHEPFTEVERIKAETTATHLKTTPTSSAPTHEPLTGESATRVSASVPVAAARPVRRASYREIPRFYFPRGKSTSRSRIVTGPLHKRLSNPHLVVPSGVSMMPVMYDGQEGVHSPMDANFGAERAPQQRPATALSALRCLDDRNVQHYIEKEFARHPSIGAAAKLSQRVQVMTSVGTNRSGGGSSGNNSGSHVKLRSTSSGKKEGGGSGWQHLVQCMQRLCTQCFGLPRYFAYLLIQLLQHDLVAGKTTNAEDTSLHSNNNNNNTFLSGNVNGTPPPPPPNATNGATPLITAQQVYEFYETHLRTKEAVRRSFDVLQLSAQLSTSTASHTTPPSSAAAVVQPIHVESPARNYLLAEDFQAYLNALLDYHPGLAFLKQTPDFQQKYVETVIYRIFYEVDRFDTGRISFAEFSTSRLMDAFRQVDANEDINAVLLFFSYEHFYVLYCRFWEIDTDRDMMLTQDDLAQYLPEDLMNPLVTERVFAGVGRPSRCTVPAHMGYEDFVYFCLAEEDKSTRRAIRYWFRILDLDADGVLSVFEMRKFYDATVAKLERYLQDSQITFNDVIYQIFDMMRVPQFRGLTLADLLREPESAEVALNMLTNVVKFIQGEQRDPFVAHQERLLGGPEQSTWDRFARREYDRMAQEADE